MAVFADSMEACAEIAKMIEDCPSVERNRSTRVICRPTGLVVGTQDTTGGSASGPVAVRAKRTSSPAARRTTDSLGIAAKTRISAGSRVVPADADVAGGRAASVERHGCGDEENGDRDSAHGT